MWTDQPGLICLSVTFLFPREHSSGVQEEERQEWLLWVGGECKKQVSVSLLLQMTGSLHSNLSENREQAVCNALQPQAGRLKSLKGEG